MTADDWSLLGYGFLAAVLIAIAVTVLIMHFVSLPFIGAGALIAVIVVPVYWLARYKERERRRD